MKKIQTIFERNWEGNRGIIDKLVVDISGIDEVTEKLDGTNVRMTVRNHMIVRLEKRRNPSKLEKAKGISEPWYVDADEYSPGDKYLWEAARNTDTSMIEDGEWSGEAIGPKIQGNPLNLEKHEIVLFSHPKVRNRLFISLPIIEFDALKEFVSSRKSLIGNDCGIEGLVFYREGEPFGKIKLKDYK